MNVLLEQNLYVGDLLYLFVAVFLKITHLKIQKFIILKAIVSVLKYMLIVEVLEKKDDLKEKNPILP